GTASKRRRRRRRRRLDFRIAILLVLAVPALLMGPWYVAYASSLPDVSQLSTDVPGDSIVYAADKTTVLADLHPAGYQHYYEPLSAMGTALPDAIVAIEDRNFSSDPGLDPAGLARAAVVALKAHDAVQGATTITHQLATVRRP